MSQTATSSRLVGVLGGMGPAATADFYQKLIAATPAEIDQDHLRVVIWSDPTVPSRQDALLNNGIDPTPWLSHGADQLDRLGAEIAVVPCNTVHPYLKTVFEHRDIEFISIIDSTIAALPREDHGAPIGLLATDAALKADIYQEALTQHNRTYVLPDSCDQISLMRLVHAVKRGAGAEDVRTELASIVRSLTDKGATTVIAGCTELSTLLDSMSEQQGPRIIDPATELARRTVVAAVQPAHLGNPRVVSRVGGRSDFSEADKRGSGG